MIEEKSIFIAAELLPALGYVWKGPLTTISPLHYPDSPEMEKMVPFLIDENLVGQDGELTAIARPVVERLARAQTFTRVYITSRFGLSEYLMYFMPDGYWISISQVGKYVQIESPGKIDVAVEAIRQQIGDSVFASASLHAVLEPPEALVLGAIWDLQRDECLKALADENQKPMSRWDAGQILARLYHKDEKYLSLTNVVRDWVEFEGELSDRDFEAAAGNLVTNKYLVEHDSSYALTGDALEFSRNMLVFSNVITLTSGIEGPDGEVAVVGFSCLQGGVHDLLMIDFQQGKLELDSVSAAEVVDYIDAFMRKPLELLAPFTPKPVPKPLEPEAPQIPAKAKVQTCPKCGNSVTSGKKFCGSCGAALNTPPHAPVALRASASTCPKCGSPVTPGKKFCGSCGEKLVG